MAYQSFTWSTLRSRLAERYEGKPFWDATEALYAMNESLRFYNLLTGFWRTRVPITTVANQYRYTLPSIMFARSRVEFNSIPLSSSSREDLNAARLYWRNETTASGSPIPNRPVVFVPLSLTNIYIWPADAVGGNTLLIDGVSDTPALDQDEDFIDIGEEQLDALLGMALHTLSFKKGGPFFEATKPLFRAFLATCAEENSQLKASSLFRRVMGLEHREEKKLSDVPTLIDTLPQAVT